MGAAHGAIIWKDATGALVPFLLGMSTQIDEQGGLFADATGVVWYLSYNNGTNIIPPSGQYNDAPYAEYWDGTNCMGTPYVQYVHARFAFTLFGQNGNTIHALKDNASVSMQFLQSYYDGTCHNNTVHILAAPLSDAPVVTPPATLPFTLPVHPEMIP
jgi:hypothetical protein